jgi:hypothetical protein
MERLTSGKHRGTAGPYRSPLRFKKKDSDHDRWGGRGRGGREGGREGGKEEGAGLKVASILSKDGSFFSSLGPCISS